MVLKYLQERKKKIYLTIAPAIFQTFVELCWNKKNTLTALHMTGQMFWS